MLRLNVLQPKPNLDHNLTIPEIRFAAFPQDLPVVGALFRAYAESLQIDLGFQDFDAELAGLPGKYAPPDGRLLLAWQGASPVGCVALRRINDVSCEMKRLYVRPEMQGRQFGRKLAERICEEAREAGYAKICLDTLSSMTPAVTLYTSMGFTPIAPYVYNPIPDVVFLGRTL